MKADSKNPQEIGNPTPAHADEILKHCSDILPNTILASLLGVAPSSLTKMRRRLGLKINRVGSKKTALSFLETLPDLSELTLTMAERKFVALERREWLEHKGKGREWLERARELMENYSNKVPTSALAAIIQMSPTWIKAQQAAIGIEISRKEFTKLRHRFGKAESPPTLGNLNAEEKRRLVEAWGKAHGTEIKAKQGRESRSKEYEAKLLGVLRSARDESALPLQKCSGTCGESWPRTKQFFIPNFRSHDKLGERCKYCTLRTRNAAKAEKQEGKRKIGRVPTLAEYVRLCELVQKYWRIIPSPLLRAIFKISEGTLSRIRHDMKIDVSAAETKTIYWRYFFRTPPHDLPLLTEQELVNLHLLSIRWREIMGRRFERDSAREERLKLIAYSMIQQSRAVEEQLTMRCCSACSANYPDLPQFFRLERGKTASVCRICISYNQRRKLWAKLKRRFNSD